MNCFLEIVNQPFKHCGGGGSLWIFCSSHSAHGLRIHMSRSTFCLKPWLLLKIIWQGRLHPDGVEDGRLWEQWQVQWVLEPSPCWCDSDPSPGKLPRLRMWSSSFPSWVRARCPPCRPVSTALCYSFLRGYSHVAPQLPPAAEMK